MHSDKRINQDLSESGQHSLQHRDPTQPEFDGLMVFRALGYVVGLLSFMVGTAFLMLGYALEQSALGVTACVLYSLAIVSLAGRPLLLKLNPVNEWHALGWIVGVLMVGSLIFLILRGIFQLMGLFG